MRKAFVAGVLTIVASLALPAAPARSQAPPPSPEAAAITHCLCLRQSVDAANAERQAKEGKLAQTRGEMARLDAELAGQRSRVDVNNPESVSRYKQLLEQRDGLARMVTPAMLADVRQSVDRYNAMVNENNAQCANHPFNSALMSQIQATLSCPPRY
jgi:hypothetical protein